MTDDGNGKEGDENDAGTEDDGDGYVTRRRLLAAGGVLGAGVVGGSLAGVYVVSPEVSVETLEEEYTNEESEFTNIDGARVHYRDQGPSDAPPVVLVHGFASSLHTWEGWVEHLTDDYRVITLDLPAFGLTGPNDIGQYGADYYAEVVGELADELGLDSFVLGGNSMGGEVSWRYALNNPDRLEKLLLVDAAGYSTQGEGESIFITLARYPVLDRIPRHITPRSAITGLVESAYADDSLVTDELVERYYDLLRREGNREAIVQRMQSLPESREDEVPEIEIPTLVMWGEQDTWIPLEHGERFADEIPDAELVTYEGVGHVPMEEVPDMTVPDVAEFLEG
ncbi:MAG: alpha/beta hydrolase [Halobacteriales archaeon]|nr:alpha/beta hydrolase [Halobacteriales archaeon]